MLIAHWPGVDLYQIDALWAQLDISLIVLAGVIRAHSTRNVLLFR